VAAVRGRGPGGRHLIQHSAGSGKTNSIAWTAHLLSDLHDTLVQQAASNSKEQFANSPDLPRELVGALISALDAHTAMSTQALNSESVRRGLLEILLNHADLYESLRARAA
jgi:hypothetical protein